MKISWAHVGLLIIGLIIGGTVAPSVVGASAQPAVKDGPPTPVTIVDPLPVPVTGEVTVAAMPEREPFQCSAVGRIEEGTLGTGLGTCIDLAENQKAHIVDATMTVDGYQNGTVAPEGAMLAAYVSTKLGSVTALHAIGQGSLHTGIDNEQYVSGRTMNVHADPGTTVGVSVKRNYAHDGLTVIVLVSGYIETID